MAAAPDLSVLVLIGMRGCGKTANGKAAAKALGRTFVDLDDVFEEETGTGINEFVDEHGWPAMRALEADILARALTGKPLAGHSYGADNPVVFACGGGVIETPESVVALKRFCGVVFVDRNIADIVEYLEGAGSYRPGLGDHPATIFERRLPLYEQCCDYQFTIPKGDNDFDGINNDCGRLMTFITGDSDPAASTKAGAAVLSLARPEYGGLTAADVTVSAGGVVELRADMLAQTDGAFVHEQISRIRRHLPKDVPLRFVLRTAANGGEFVGEEDNIFRILGYAVTAGVEIIDVELCWSEGARDRLRESCSKSNSRLRPFLQSKL